MLHKTAYAGLYVSTKNLFVLPSVREQLRAADVDWLAL